MFLSMKKVLPILCLLAMNLNLFGQMALDVHSHFSTPEFLQVLAKHDALLDEGFPIPDWTLEEHLKFMENAGIEKSVLTLPAPQPYFGDTGETAAIIRQTNEYAARLKADYPDRFLFCAALPLPDIGAAIKEAIYALDTLHADGIKLATNSRGQYLGEAELDPLMQLLSDRGAVVILHPHKPDPYNQQVMQQTPLAMYEYLAETTRALANMITRNVLARYPGMKVVVVEDLISTGGSSLKAVEAIRRDGCEVIGMVASYTYGFPVAEKAFKEAKVPLVTLTDYDAVIETALKTGYIEEKDIPTLNEWRKDPAHWGDDLK